MSQTDSLTLSKTKEGPIRFPPTSTMSLERQTELIVLFKKKSMVEVGRYDFENRKMTDKLILIHRLPEKIQEACSICGTKHNVICLGFKIKDGKEIPFLKCMKRKPGKWRLVDLFSGTGAFTQAFKATGQVEVVFANDMVPASKTIYDLNHGDNLTLDVIHNIPTNTIPAHDILTAGFPCQPFSQAGKKQGFADARSNVFWKILEILDYHHPRCIVLENVKNLVSHDNGNTFKTIKTNLEERGYTLTHKVLNTAEITGVPQHRERIYIVGFLGPGFTGCLLNFPRIPKRPLTDFLELDAKRVESYYYKPDSAIYPELVKSVTKTDRVYQWRRVYVRENMSGEVPTLTANAGTGGHNVPIILGPLGPRKLTPRECFNFQGFPPDYLLPKIADCHLYKLAGNAVSLPVVELIAKEVIGVM